MRVINLRADWLSLIWLSMVLSRIKIIIGCGIKYDQVQRRLEKIIKDVSENFSFSTEMAKHRPPNKFHLRIR